MSQPQSIRFLATDLEILFPAGPVTAQAWVSNYGASRLMLPMGARENLKLNEPLGLRFDSFHAQAVIVQQFTQAGLSYGARFLSLPLEQQAYLAERIEKEGVRPSWSRRFPRILVAELANRATPHPQHCLFPWMGQELPLQVINFTVDGIRLLWPGEPRNLRVGNMVTLTVYTSTGDAITGIEAEIRNFSCLEDSERGVTTELGIRFMDMRSQKTEAYRNLIRACVTQLRSG